MKFSEMPYTRPDYAAAAKELDSLTARLRGAASAPEQVALYKEYETLLSHLSTQATLCSIRHTVDGGGPPYIHKGKQTIAFQGTPFFQAFPADTSHEEKENVA